jgi:hypothetical protein
MVAILSVIGIHYEQTTLGLANTYGQALILSVLPTAFGCKCNHTLFTLNSLSVVRPILYILATPLLC